MPDETSQVGQGAGAGNGNAGLGVGLGTPNAGGQGQQPGSQPGSGQGNAGDGKSWFDGLVKDGDNLRTIQAKKWDSAEAMVKSYRELETAYSSRGSGAAPANPSDYQFQVPQGFEQGYNQEFAEGFKTWAHKNGLSKEQASGIHDSFVEFAKGALQSQANEGMETINVSVAESKHALEQAWGVDNSPTFTRNLEMAKRAIAQLDPDLMGELRELGAVVNVGGQDMIAKPAIFKALAKAGGQMFAEDNLFGQPAATKNPFAKDSQDMTAQGRIIQADPAKAKLLIRAAGEDAIRMYKHFLAE